MQRPSFASLLNYVRNMQKKRWICPILWRWHPTLCQLDCNLGQSHLAVGAAMRIARLTFLVTVSFGMLSKFNLLSFLKLPNDMGTSPVS
mmetsp:Transcript_17058/g.44989  ORF Transcript_17058/g.44989 Transcript_17058/m.44989 type:complete len:89 (+) Transcript_17058:117-383(+)